jgi:hypothetical protein
VLTAENEFALMETVVNWAVLGDADLAVPGILATEGGLAPFFSGEAGNSTNSRIDRMRNRWDTVKICTIMCSQYLHISHCCEVEHFLSVVHRGKSILVIHTLQHEYANDERELYRFQNHYHDIGSSWSDIDTVGNSMPFWTILTSNKSGVAKLVIKGGKHNRNDHALQHILQESTDATTSLQASNSNETNNKF